MSRKIIIAGNWKMYKTNAEARQLATQIKMKATDIRRAGIILCPSFTALPAVAEAVKDTSIGLGAQNMYWEKEGAFTGEISAGMVKSAGASYVIIGHSERRQYFGETDETVNKKIKAALDNGLNPIVCVGESLQQREDNITREVVTKQIKGALAGLKAQEMQHIIIAYEPIWAIGTGKTATPEQAEEVHRQIRKILSEMFGDEVAAGVIIQYGGSVKPENAEELLSQPDIDGALVGGASLKADSFAAIFQTAERLSVSKKT
ncbi:MAG TPA: triose-phosphate isomerase [Calditrichaeota bacterium]|nr:triose-phosphate isomerase [Calditrichota bacterium]